MLDLPDRQMHTGSLNGDLAKDGIQGGCSLCVSTVFAKDNSPRGVFISKTKLSLQSKTQYSSRSLYSASGLVAPLAHICTTDSFTGVFRIVLVFTLTIAAELFW